MAKTKTKNGDKKAAKQFNREDFRKTTRSGRWYVLPDGGNDGRKFPSVTTIIGDGMPKPALFHWAGKFAAEFAVENLEMVNKMAAEDSDQGAVDWIKGASGRYTAKAGKEGSAVHDFAEAYFLGEDPDPDDFSVSQRTDSMIEQIIHFVHAIKPKFVHVEPTLYSQEHGYAGAADMVVKIKNKELLNLLRWKKKRQPTLILDIKTSNSGVYPETALQIAAYANADTLLTMDGETHPVPKIDLGGVIHVSEDAWSLVPVTIDDYVFETFLHAMKTAEWQQTTDTWRGSRPVVGNVIARGSAS